MDQAYFWNQEMTDKFFDTSFQELPSIFPPGDLKGSCFQDNNSNLWNDPRYVKMSENGPFISHKQIMHDNQIDRVKEQTMREVFEDNPLRRNQESKSDKVILNFWARPNLELKSQCQAMFSMSKKQLMVEID